MSGYSTRMCLFSHPRITPQRRPPALPRLYSFAIPNPPPPSNSLLIHTHTTPTNKSESDGFSTATAASQAYLDSIGLRSLLKDGVVRLLETNPLPASTLSAWVVLATEVTRVIKAQGHGQANDAVASAMLAGFESLGVPLVRGGERGRRRVGGCA